MRAVVALAAVALAAASFPGEELPSHYIAQRRLIEGDPQNSRNCPRCPGLASPRTNPEVRDTAALYTRISHHILIVSIDNS